MNPKYRVMGIYREPEHSPGMEEADKAIMDAVLNYLALHGCAVSVYHAQAPVPLESRNVDLVLAMCKSRSCLEQLKKFERSGKIVVNSAASIRSCYRDVLCEVLKRASVPTPPGTLVSTENVHLFKMGDLDPERGIFVKPADPTAVSSGHVVEIHTAKDLQRVLEAYRAKKIRYALLQQAQEGVVVKFYGVGDDYFSFHCRDSRDIPSEVVPRLAQIATRTAKALGLEVWGGDAIVNKSEVFFVDFNDWPSFAPVRAIAAQAIGRRCLQLLSHA